MDDSEAGKTSVTLMHRLPENPNLSFAVRTTLDALRRRIRLYVWAHGLAAAVACLGAAFWASLVLDWFFEPPVEFRLLLLIFATLGLGGLLFYFIIRRVFARLSDANMAMLLERRFPQLDDSVLTAVVLAGHVPESEGFDPEMLARTSRNAAERIAAVRLAEVFNPAPLRRSMFAALALVASIVAFAVLVPEGFGIWTRRGLMLSDELWPRRTRLEIVGFDRGATKVARGADFELLAKADTDMPVVPDTLYVRYRTDGGAHALAAMTREGNAVPSRDAFQEYSYTFRGVLTPIEFDLSGGDASLRGLRIEVVDSPTIDQMVLHCRYPDYMARKPQDVPVIGVMQIPEGTEVRVDGRANKPLARVDVESALDDPEFKPAAIEPGGEPAFQYAMPVLEKDRTLLFTLLDTDGIRSREPIRLALAAVADQAPELPVQLRGIGTAITPEARLPMVGRVTDDYGVARVWFEYGLDKAAPAEQEVVSPEGNPTELKIDHAMEVRELGLKPDQKLLVCLKAADRRDRNGGPNVGASQRWLLDVVTPERLRIMLQSRELVLRQRFEMIIQEVTETRDSLVRMEFGAAEAAKPADAKPEGAEPGDAPAAARAADAPERSAALRSLRCERAVQNCRKNTAETLGTAEAFDAIRLELVNNRIDTEELKDRLASKIAEPLRQIADAMFPELEKRLVALRKTLDDPQRGPKDRDFARQQVDAILVGMNQVLSRMIELEDFNEAVALLQGIIDAQEKLGREAQDRQKSTLQDLLEDKP